MADKKKRKDQIICAHCNEPGHLVVSCRRVRAIVDGVTAAVNAQLHRSAIKRRRRAQDKSKKGDASVSEEKKIPHKVQKLATATSDETLMSGALVSARDAPTAHNASSATGTVPENDLHAPSAADVTTNDSIIQAITANVSNAILRDIEVILNRSLARALQTVIAQQGQAPGQPQLEAGVAEARKTEKGTEEEGNNDDVHPSDA